MNKHGRWQIAGIFVVVLALLVAVSLLAGSQARP